MTSPSERTRKKLILAAERLFALHGVDGVSLRQVNTEAGQRNSSAAHYHFGSREALIEAVYLYRMERIWEYRKDMLEQAVRDGRCGELRTLIDIVIRPIVMEMISGPGGRFYVNFVMQVWGHPHFGLGKMQRMVGLDSIEHLLDYFHDVLAHLPESLFRQRIGFMFIFVYQVLALNASSFTNPDALEKGEGAVLLNNLMDVIENGLAAPVSDDTQRHFSQLE